MSTAPTKRPQTVTPEGVSVAPAIDGVRIRRAITHPDPRGTVCEIFDATWDFSDDPLVYVYEITIRPGVVKGWSKHERLDDRLFTMQGSIRVVLYDDREGSPTRGLVTDQTFDDHGRALIRIPAGVWHAVGNVGLTDARLVNCPTRAYDHADPDKWDLPLDTDLIPFRF
ncbi:MAG: dTDP-4-dehydrorhamnose 3,5-epimerase family protein [Actinomycetota bacterium]|nr:dTDP-4-dehydrorhamnose 3,5-epimerase family protein [Actinomycetota bacterium]